MQAMRTIARKSAEMMHKSAEEGLDSRLDPIQKLVSEKIENLAVEVREMGRESGHEEWVRNVARRLERTADYLRYRPASRIARDASRSTRVRQTVGVGAAAVGVLVAYGLWKRSRRSCCEAEK